MSTRARQCSADQIAKRIAIVAGMPRSGTTSLYYFLGQHPSIFVPFLKETDFFSFNCDRGLEWYCDLFREMRAGQTGIDISPSYFYDPQAAVRIKAANKDAKVILAVRNPVEFVVSWYARLILLSGACLHSKDSLSISNCAWELHK